MLPNLFTPGEMQSLLAARCKTLRLAAGYKRTTLAQRAGVSEASLKRFERTGEISLKSLLLLAHALGALQDFAGLLPLPQAQSLAGLRAESARVSPRRGRI